MEPAQQTTTVTVELDDNDIRALQALARKRGITTTEALRRAIRQSKYLDDVEEAGSTILWRTRSGTIRRSPSGSTSHREAAGAARSPAEQATMPEPTPPETSALATDRGVVNLDEVPERVSPGPDDKGGPRAVVREERYDPTRDSEKMRGAIAIVLLSILAAVILFAFIGLWTMRITIDDTRVILELLFAPLVGLVGAVTGFYYGSRAGKD